MVIFIIILCVGVLSWQLNPECWKGKVIVGKLRFEVVYNILFCNYFMHRSVVMATVKVSVVTKSRILARKSYCW